MNAADMHTSGAKRPRAPKAVSIKLPADVAEALHRLAYETGCSKQSLLVEGFRRTWMTASEPA